MVDDDEAKAVLDEVLPSRLEQLQRFTGLPVVLAGTTRRELSRRRLALHHFRGTIGQSLEGVVLDQGQALGGAVVLRGTPCRVDDYATTSAITHEYDRIIVGEERITSMVGIPLRLGGIVRGVLYGATRGGLSIGDVALRHANGIAAAINHELDEALHGPRELLDDLPRDRAAAVEELARIAATVRDPALRRRLAQVHRVLCADQAPPAAVGGPLSPRELDVLRLVAIGRSNREIAPLLGLRPETVKAYLRSTMRKLGVANRTEAAHAARTAGIL